mmetsp:Transcript_29986/g.47002  ORF Transcript_29986/g.47002 Transcript_29986/m.47002 type:complete len:90 (-) Transcript_29986:3510-3779(-)
MTCRECFSGTLDEGTPQGTETTISGYDTYVANPSGQSQELESYKTTTVFLITDVFGWRIPNIRLFADEMAEKLKIKVFVPDLHQGKPIP